MPCTSALAGACLGFYRIILILLKYSWRYRCNLLGFILATVSIEGLFKGYAVVSFAVPLLILGLPIFDTGYAY